MEFSWKLFALLGFSLVLICLAISVTAWIVLKLKEIGKPADQEEQDDFDD
jgi:hypothetical protein